MPNSSHPSLEMLRWRPSPPSRSRICPGTSLVDCGHLRLVSALKSGGEVPVGIWQVSADIHRRRHLHLRPAPPIKRVCQARLVTSRSLCPNRDRFLLSQDLPATPGLIEAVTVPIFQNSVCDPAVTRQRRTSPKN